MDYFSLLNLDREPFSNSPNPDFFFQSRQHVDCLQKLELALRLKRGLNIVIGAVGAGKTTLCRTLLNRVASDGAIEAHLILDPSFSSPLAFLENICTMIVGNPFSSKDAHGYKEQIKHQLYQKGVSEKKTVILVIDEGQKLPVFCLEILREFLNYETNDHKLLQIVLFAQEEIQDILDRHANLADRVNLIHFLGPMSLADTRKMIRFRIKQASSHPQPPHLFTGLALRAIYRATGGYPRKIINLCHQCILAMIVQNRTRVDWHLVRSCRNRSLAQRRQPRRNRRTLALSTLSVVAALILVYILNPGWLRSTALWIATPPPTTMPAVTHQPPPMAASISDPDRPAPSVPSRAGVRMAVPSPPTDEAIAAATPIGPSSPPVQTIVVSNMPGVPDPADEAAPSDRPARSTDSTTPVPPPLLGTLTAKKNDTLGSMIRIIYGDFRQRTLEAVLAANPHIGDANAIRVGDTIAFPAIPTVFIQRTYPLWWLKAGDTGSLDAAFRRSIGASKIKDAPLLRIITTWDHRSGLKYGIYVAGYFFDLAAAENMMARLPVEFAGTAKIISGWPDQSILFSDPFLGQGH
jgi:general secretion pathway protein A